MRLLRLTALLLLLATATQAQPAVTTPGGFFTPQGRLTLASGYPVYNPLPATPSSTDTSAETTTFASPHGWVTGTMVTPSATGGGLTAGTQYFVCAVSTTAVSYYANSVTNAETCGAGGLTNLTASITAEIRPSGVRSSTLRYTCYVPGKTDSNATASCWAPKWTGSTTTSGHFEMVPIRSELSLAVTTTGGFNYNVYLQASGTTLALVLGAVWTNDTTPSETLVTPVAGSQLAVLSTDPTKLYVGICRANAINNTCEDTFSNLGTVYAPVRGVWNAHNRVLRRIYYGPGTSHTYNSNTVRQWNADANAYLSVVGGTTSSSPLVYRTTLISGTGGQPRAGYNIDATTPFDTSEGSSTAYGFNAVAGTAFTIIGASGSVVRLTPGYHKINALEQEATNSVSSTFSAIILMLSWWD